jgi:hypothetical protein
LGQPHRKLEYRLQIANGRLDTEFSTELPTEKPDINPLSTAFANILFKASITRRNNRGNTDHLDEDPENCGRNLLICHSLK